MASEPLLNPTGCFPLSNWPSAFVPILAVPMNHIFLFPKRSRDYALGPKDAQAYYNRGRYYADRKDDERALKDYDLAIELDPSYANSYNARGNLYYDRK